MTEDEKWLVDTMVTDGYVDFFNKDEEFYYYDEDVLNRPSSSYIELEQKAKDPKRIYYEEILDLLFHSENWSILEDDDESCIRIFTQFNDTIEIIFYLYDFILRNPRFDISHIVYKNIKKYKLDKL